MNLSQLMAEGRSRADAALAQAQGDARRALEMLGRDVARHAQEVATLREEVHAAKAAKAGAESMASRTLRAEEEAALCRAESAEAMRALANFRALAERLLAAANDVRRPSEALRGARSRMAVELAALETSP